jgi:hypothetical protein
VEYQQPPSVKSRLLGENDVISLPEMRSVQDHPTNLPVPLGSEPLAANIVGWFATPEQGLRGEVTELHGTAAVSAALAELALCRLELEADASDGEAWWGEITRTTPDDAETCLVHTSLDDAGRVERLLWFRAARIPGGNALYESSSANGHAVIETYFDHLTNHRFDEAVGCFTADCLYSHPPYRGAPERVLFSGSEALLDGLVNVRGRSSVQVLVETVVQNGRWVFVEGGVKGIPNGGTFTAAARLGPGNQIERYVAFYSAQRLTGRY